MKSKLPTFCLLITVLVSGCGREETADPEPIMEAKVAEAPATSNTSIVLIVQVILVHPPLMSLGWPPAMVTPRRIVVTGTLTVHNTKTDSQFDYQ